MTTLRYRHYSALPGSLARCFGDGALLHLRHDDGEIKLRLTSADDEQTLDVDLRRPEARELGAWLLARTGRRDLADLALQEPRGYHFIPGPDGEKRLAQMIDWSGAAGTQDVVRRALAIYEALLQHRVALGRVLHLVDPDGRKFRLPIWPGDDFESRTPPSIGELLKTQSDLRKDWGGDS